MKFEQSAPDNVGERLAEDKIEIVNEQQLLTLIRKSYELAQGHPEFQYSLLRACSNVVRIELDISSAERVNELREKFFTTLGLPAEAPTENENEKPYDSFKFSKIKAHTILRGETVQAEFERFETLLQQLTQETTESDFRMIPAYMWHGDNEFLINQKGRPNRSDDESTANTLRDKWFSYGVHYLLRENSTRNEIFDKVLAEARTTDSSVLQEDKESVTNVVATYNLHHEQSRVSHEELEGYFTARGLNSQEGSQPAD